MAAGRGGLGGSRSDEHPGGGAEQRQARVAQEAATSEPDLRELLVVETLLQIEGLLEIQPLLDAYRHTRLAPFARFFFRANPFRTAMMPPPEAPRILQTSDSRILDSNQTRARAPLEDPGPVGFQCSLNPRCRPLPGSGAPLR
jgi:hypothetical protein